MEFYWKETPAFDKSTDEQLMETYQLGDHQAFEALYKRYSGKTYAYIKKRLKDPMATEDVFQSVFMNFHRARGQYTPGQPFLPWFFSICRNACIDRARQDEHFQQEHANALLENEPANQWEEDFFGHDPLLDLSILPSDQRQAVQLRFCEGRSYDEIALRLQTSTTNARQLVSRAIKKLRTLTNLTGLANFEKSG